MLSAYLPTYLPAYLLTCVYVQTQLQSQTRKEIHVSTSARSFGRLPPEERPQPWLSTDPTLSDVGCELELGLND